MSANPEWTGTGGAEDGRLGLTADRATRASTEPASGLGPDGRVSTDAGHTPWVIVDAEDGLWIETKNGVPLLDNAGKMRLERMRELFRIAAAAPELLTLVEDVEQSLTADDTYRLLREACRTLIAKARGQ